MVTHLALALQAGRLQRETTSLTLVEQSADGPVLHSPGLGNPDRVTATTNGPNGHTAEDASPDASARTADGEPNALSTDAGAAELAEPNQQAWEKVTQTKRTHKMIAGKGLQCESVVQTGARFVPSSAATTWLSPPSSVQEIYSVALS